MATVDDESTPVIAVSSVRPMRHDLDAWELVRNRGWIPEDALLPALRRTAEREPDADYRTRMLVHDALDALAGRWGEAAVRQRLGDDAPGLRLAEYWADEYDKEGFWSIKLRLVEPVTPDIIFRMLRELGGRLHRPASIDVGGSCALILAQVLLRATDDMDVVDELPEAIRTDHQLVADLVAKHGLRLTHFASHYLPSNWQNRTRSLERIGKLDVRVVDPVDIIAGKFFSKRIKDFKDIQTCWENIDLETLRDRLKFNTAALRSEERLLEAATHNWYVLTGEEPLP